MKNIKKTVEISKILPEFTELREANNLLRACYKCTLMQKKIIEMSISTIQRIETQTLFGKEIKRVAMFSISDFRKKYELSDAGAVYNLIKRSISKIAKAGFSKETNDEYHYYNWFEQIHYSKKNDFIEFVFTQPVGDAILQLTKNYGIIKLSVTKHFRSFYAAKFYDYAISMKGMKGKFFDLSEKQIRDFMGIDEKKYKDRQNNFEKKVIQEPLRELNEIDECEFYLEYCKIKDYNTTVGWHFEIKEKYKTLVIKKNDSNEDKATKCIINAEKEFIAKHKAEYDELVAKIHAETAKDENIFHRELMHAETQAFDILSKKYEGKK